MKCGKFRGKYFLEVVFDGLKDPVCFHSDASPGQCVSKAKNYAAAHELKPLEPIAWAGDAPEAAPEEPESAPEVVEEKKEEPEKEDE